MSLEADEVAWVTKHMHHFCATVSDSIFYLPRQPTQWGKNCLISSLQAMALKADGNIDTGSR